MEVGPAKTTAEPQQRIKGRKKTGKERQSRSTTKERRSPPENVQGEKQQKRRKGGRKIIETNRKKRLWNFKMKRYQIFVFVYPKSHPGCEAGERGRARQSKKAQECPTEEETPQAEKKWKTTKGVKKKSPARKKKKGRGAVWPRIWAAKLCKSAPVKKRGLGSFKKKQIGKTKVAAGNLRKESVHLTFAAGLRKKDTKKKKTPGQGGGLERTV